MITFNSLSTVNHTPCCQELTVSKQSNVAQLSILLLLQTKVQSLTTYSAPRFALLKLWRVKCDMRAGCGWMGCNSKSVQLRSVDLTSLLLTHFLESITDLRMWDESFDLTLGLHGRLCVHISVYES